jgi:hypothetical protein
MRDAVDGMTFIHSLGKLHRDLKSGRFITSITILFLNHTFNSRVSQRSQSSCRPQLPHQSLPAINYCFAVFQSD